MEMTVKTAQQIEAVAMAIYAASFDPQTPEQAERKEPSPGWCWEKASDVQKVFCRRQALAAINAYERVR